MKKFFMMLVMMLMSITAFAGTTGIFDVVKGFVTIENVLASIGVASIIMTGVPVPRPDTKLFKIYSILKYLGGNFGFADHTKKK